LFLVWAYFSFAKIAIDMPPKHYSQGMVVAPLRISGRPLFAQGKSWQKLLIVKPPLQSEMGGPLTVAKPLSAD
jgi:hypothetical protein